MIKVTYVTSSSFKQEENRVFCRTARLANGKSVSDVFTFEFRVVPIVEMLEVDLGLLVANEVTKAYQQVRVPCVVEHAGLIFEEYRDKSYPGGLTKPMWNALGENFVEETHSSGRRAIARAVVAYCDGKSVRTFVGDTPGTIAASPRGERRFYWDTVFIPDTDVVAARGKTYSEIVLDPGLGIDFKMSGLSQSSRAMLKLLEVLQEEPNSELWS